MLIKGMYIIYLESLHQACVSFHSHVKNYQLGYPSTFCKREKPISSKLLMFLYENTQNNAVTIIERLKK